MGGGYVSKIACSEVFVAHRALADVRREDLSPFFYFRIRVHRSTQSVTAKALGLLGATSAYRKGLGCAVVVDSNTHPHSAQAEDTIPAHPVSTGPWPSGHEKHTDPVAGLDSGKLETAIARAFAAPNQRTWLTRAVVVIFDGKLVGERYAKGFSQSSRLLGWSMTKSVTSALIGIAKHKNIIVDEQERTGFPNWRNDQRNEITVDQLLRMSSGLSFDETYQPLRDATRMLFESADSAAVAGESKLAGTPDTLWSYSSGTTNLLSKLLRNRIGDDTRYHRFPYETLFDPLSMRSAYMEADSSGTFVGSSFMYATAHDWARFGLLYANDGILANGTRVLPKGWVNYTRTPTSQAPRGSYGAHFWLNAGTNTTERRFPTLPADLFYADGYQGQTVAIFP